MIDAKWVPELTKVIEGFDRLGQVVQFRAVRAGLTQAAKPIVESVKRVTPMQRGGGALRRSIGSRSMSLAAKTAAGVPRTSPARFIGATKDVRDPLYYRYETKKKLSQQYKLNWLEETGARPHTVSINSKRVMASRAGGEWRVYGTVYQHPGFRARPFLQTGFNAGLGSAANAFYQGVAAYLDKTSR